MYTKFRVWDLVEEEMMYENAMDNYIVDTGEDGYFHLLKCARFYPMQFIGLTDRHGNELYEGDIVLGIDRSGEDNIKPFKGVIEFKNASFYINTGVVNHYRWIDYEIEKLGNKYEDEDLLNEEGSV